MDLKPLYERAASAHQNGDLAEASRLYLDILTVQPGNLHVQHMLGLVRLGQGRSDEALELVGTALRANPNVPETQSNYGNVLRALGRLEEAVASYDRALALKSAFPEALFNRGNVLRDLKRFEESLASFDGALAINPTLASAWNNRGNALRDLRRFAEALASYEKTLALRPGHVEALNNRALALWDLKRLEEALAVCDAALAMRPDFAEALYNRGNILRDLGRFEEAMASYERVLVLAPTHPHALSGLAQLARAACDWARTGRLAEDLKMAVEQDSAVVQPFVFLSYWDDAALQRHCAENYLRHVVPSTPPSLWDGAPYRHDKIRIAYLSADFRASAAGYLLAELFERHDRARFELTAISFGPDDGSALRARLVKAFDHFHDVRGQSDLVVAQMLRNRQIDIAIDLMGYTLDARPEILSWRPCPVQVSYLGYPGTLAADFIDYVIADKVVLPEGQQRFFTENIVHLPGSYYPAGAHHASGEPARSEAGLPERGFVFCCFNAHWKITARIFDVWMRLLARTPGSVLWLLAGQSHENLCREAAAMGIDADRLIFAAREDPGPHLARHRLADLFLDTLPYNAHTTAIDALWAGLPLITCRGEAFSARVAASLLEAIDLPELVAADLKTYESLARKLADDPARLIAIRKKIARNQAPLSDGDRFRQKLEAAYTKMWEICRDGQKPHGFAVQA